MNETQFSVSVSGELSGELFKGVFKARLRLSHHQQLQRDQFRRDLLGPNPEGASPRAHNQAELFSDIHAHLISSPSWWKDSNGGLDLEDDNVVAEVWGAIMKAKAEDQAERRKKAEAAQGELKGLEQK